MKKFFCTIIVLMFFLVLVGGCSKKKESRELSDQDKAALKGAIGLEMMKQGNKKEGMKLFNQGMDDWHNVHDKR